MVKIMFGPMVVGARGTAGGLIFTANKSGPYARSWSRGSNPRTSLQSDQRGTLTDFATNWRNLTQTQRDNWDTYAAATAQDLVNSLGETYSISGFNWYVRINTHLTLAAEADRDDAPTLTRPTAPVIEFVQLIETGGASTTKVRYAVGDPDLAANHVIFAKLVYSQGILAIPSPMPLMVIDVPNVNRDIAFETELEATFGDVQLGSRVLLSSRIQDAHGQRGPADTDFADAEV